jgi:hypothetical protein
LSLAFQPDLEELLVGVHPTGDPLTSQGSAHIGVLAVDGELAPGPDGPRKGSLLNPHEPAVRLNGLRNSRQSRKCWVSYTRWLIAAGARLIGTLLVVMGEKRLGERSRPARAWLADGSASTPDSATDESAPRRRQKSGRCGGMTWGFTPRQSRKRTSAEGRAIPSRRAADKAGVIVKGEHPVRAWGQAIRAQKLGHHLARALRRQNRHAPHGVTTSR